MSSLGRILAKVAGFIDPATGELIRAPNTRSLDWMSMPPTKPQAMDYLYAEQLPQVMGESVAYDYAPHGEAMLEPFQTYNFSPVEFTPPPVSRSPEWWHRGRFMWPDELAATGGNVYLAGRPRNELYRTTGIGPSGEMLTKPPLPGEY